MNVFLNVFLNVFESILCPGECLRMRDREPSLFKSETAQCQRFSGRERERERERSRSDEVI